MIQHKYIDYDQLLSQIENIIENSDHLQIDIDIFQTELDDNLWNDLIDKTVRSLIIDYNNNNNVQSKKKEMKMKMKMSK